MWQHFYRIYVQTYCCACSKKDIAAANFTVHEVHCVRNITLCSHCSEPIAKSDLDRHVTEQHTTVPCPHCPLQLMKSEVDRHVADMHATEPCPECGENISRTELEDHKRSVHSTIACPSCLRVVEKTSLHQHQVSSTGLSVSTLYFPYCLHAVHFGDVDRQQYELHTFHSLFHDLWITSG